jgi:hypothetical protein
LEIGSSSIIACQPIDGVAALGALFARPDLANPIENFDVNALLGQASK